MSIFRFSSAYCSLSEFEVREPALLSDLECSTKTSFRAQFGLNIIELVAVLLAPARPGLARPMRLTAELKETACSLFLLVKRSCCSSSAARLQSAASE